MPVPQLQYDGPADLHAFPWSWLSALGWALVAGVVRWCGERLPRFASWPTIGIGLGCELLALAAALGVWEPSLWNGWRYWLQLGLTLATIMVVPRTSRLGAVVMRAIARGQAPRVPDDD